MKQQKKILFDAKTFNLNPHEVCMFCAASSQHVTVPPELIANNNRPVSAEKILQAFNTWAFKREQSSDPELIKQFIERAARRQEPIPFVLYWGKGPRNLLAQPDNECLDYIHRLSERIRVPYPVGCKISICMTDRHAELNGHRTQDIASYFSAIEVAAAQRGFACCRLGQLADYAKIVVDHETPIEPDVLRQLTYTASRWYSGAGDAAEGAARYYRSNMIEKRAVELAFPNSIFITFNPSEFRYLFPESLPIFYMYSLRRGTGVKPWFLKEDGTPYHEAGSETPLSAIPNAKHTNRSVNAPERPEHAVRPTLPLKISGHQSKAHG